jgi:hypothetical protein
MARFSSSTSSASFTPSASFASFLDTLAAVKTRRRIAQALVILGNLALLALAIAHARFGYPEVSRIASEAQISPRFAAGLKLIWLLASWHWVALGITALAVSFGRRAPHRVALLLCGLTLLVDAAATLAGPGWFIGDELLTIAAVALLAAAALFPSRITAP